MGTPATQGGTVDDPFGIFGTPTPVPASLALVQAQAPAQQTASQAPTAASTEEHLWAAAGFGNETASPEQPITQSVPEQHASSTSVNFADDSTATTTNKKEEMPIILDSNGLPSEGGYYEARINVRSLGAMFYTLSRPSPPVPSSPMSPIIRLRTTAAFNSVTSFSAST